METTEYLSVNKVTQEVPVSRQTIWRAVASGELRARQLKPRGPLLIERRDLTAWLDSKVVVVAANSEKGK